MKIIRQYSLFLIGLFIASMGVAFSTKAGLGTSPVASLPYSVSLVSSLLSFGGWLNVLSVIQIAVQVILLRKKCKPLEIVIQTVLAFVYGYLTNLSCFIISGIEVHNYFEQLLYMLLGCVILAFGIWLQLKGKVAMLPGGTRISRSSLISSTSRFRRQSALYFSASSRACAREASSPRYLSD